MGEIAFTPYSFDYASPSKTVANYVIRDANGGLVGEWGSLAKEHYPDSNWPSCSAAENIFYWGTHYKSTSGVINGVNGQAKKGGSSDSIICIDRF